ncbi:MAG: ABC transporter permease [Acidobacteria bacterium]|nr:ABC transporter permease [Acidobacteriota bacterium]
MASLALKNLFHDKIRLTVTLVGIVFSVVLSSIQLGLFVGFQRATSDILYFSNADLWIASKNVTHAEDGVPFSERKLYQALASPRVERIEKQIFQFTTWKKPDGADTGVLLVGFDLAGGMGAPWNITEGRIEDLNQPDAVMIEELYKDKLGVSRIGETVEIRGHRAKVVGFTRGIRSFTTSPPVFTSFKNAQNFFGLREDQTLFLVVKAKPGVDPESLKSELQSLMTDVDVYTRAEWTSKQRNYWMFGTGAGITVLIAAFLGLLVGVVVVAQTIYSATVDHIREYGTLKAMGASNFYLYRVIVTQAFLSGLIGYAVGMSVALLVSRISLEGTTAIILPKELVVGLFFLTILMCVGASVVSINKVTRIDPAMVFKG